MIKLLACAVTAIFPATNAAAPEPLIPKKAELVHTVDETFPELALPPLSPWS